MRFAASLLSVALLTSPAWAADTATPDTSSPGAQTIQSPAQLPSDRIILLLPTSEIDGFRQALSGTLANDIQVMPASDTVSLQGQSYSLIAVPASALQQIDQDLAGKPFHGDLQVVLPFGQFVNVADFSSFEQGNMQAADTSTESKEQTSAQSSDSSGPANQEGQSAQSGPTTYSQTTTTTTTTAPSAASTMPTDQGFWSDKVVLLVPNSDLKNFSQSAGDRQILVVMPYDRFAHAAPGASISQSQTSTTVSPSREQTSSMSISSATGEPFLFSGLDKNHTMLIVPTAQLQSFDQMASSGGQQPFVLLPYDRFIQIADPSKLSQTSGQPLVSALDKDHVMLVVPSDQLKNFNQLAAQAGNASFVSVPLDRLGQVMDQSSAAIPPAAAQMTESTTTTVTPLREPTSYPASDVPPAYSGNLVTLQSAGEANSVINVIPVGGGTLVYLRDGTLLTVPDSVNLPGNITTGSWVQAQYEQRGGQNLVTSIWAVSHRDQAGG